MSDESVQEIEAKLFASARAEHVADAVRERAVSRMLQARRRRHAKVVLAASLLAAAAAAAMVGLLGQFERSAPPSIVAERVPPGAARANTAAARPEPTLAPALELPTKDPTRPSIATKVKAAPQPVPSNVRPLTLAAETTALQGVQAQLRAGNPGAALAELDRYELAAHDKHLGSEAHLLRIQVLAASGRTAEASALARSFVNAYPNSPLVDRARRYVVASEVGGKDPNGEPGR